MPVVPVHNAHVGTDRRAKARNQRGSFKRKNEVRRGAVNGEKRTVAIRHVDGVLRVHHRACVVRLPKRK